MDADGKPKPLPRKLGKLDLNGLLRDSHGSSSSSDDGQSFGTTKKPTMVNPVVPCSELETTLSVPFKPVPLPRKLPTRLNRSSNGSDHVSSSDDDFSKIPDSPRLTVILSQQKQKEAQQQNHEDGSLSSDLKRKTINLFVRKLDNPFGTEFEDSLKDAPSYKTVVTPCEEIPQEVWSKLAVTNSSNVVTSSSSTSKTATTTSPPGWINPESDDDDDDNDVTSFITTDSKTVDTINIFTPKTSTGSSVSEDRFSTTELDNKDNSNTINEFELPINNLNHDRLKKNLSCPAAPDSSEYFPPIHEYNIQSQDSTSSAQLRDSIYETISSYSSSESGMSSIGVPPSMIPPPPPTFSSTSPFLDEACNMAPRPLTSASLSSSSASSSNGINSRSSPSGFELDRPSSFTYSKSSNVYEDYTPIHKKPIRKQIPIENLSLTSLPSSSSSTTTTAAAAATINVSLSDKINKLPPKNTSDTNNSNKDINKISTSSLVRLSMEKNEKEIIQRRNSANRSNNTKSVELNTKKHEYDEVAIEDGNVIINSRASTSVLPNTSSSSSVGGIVVDCSILQESKLTNSNSPNSNTSSNSNSSVPSRSSVLVEFDPLFESWSDALTTATTTTINSSNNRKSNQSTGNVPVYEDVDDDEAFLPDKSIGLKSEEIPGAKTIPIIPTEEEEYEPVLPPKDNKNIIKNSSKILKARLPSPPTSTTKDDNLDATSSCSSSSSSSSTSASEKDSNINQNPLPPTPPTTKSSDSGPNFLKRISHRIRLIPIREEIFHSSRKESIPDSTTKKCNDSATCAKCFEEHSENSHCKFSPVARENTDYASNLFKASGMSKRDFVKRRAVLSKGKLAFLKPGESKEIDIIALEKIVMVSKKDDHRVSQSEYDLKCFQLTLGNGKYSTMVLAGTSEEERSLWMQKYIESFTSAFPITVISSFDRGGWCFIKESVTSEWKPSWFVLHERKLMYAFNNCQEHHEIDLRKVRGITLAPKEGDHKCPYVDNNDVLTLDVITKILYMQTENPKITSQWEKAIRSAALFNGDTFEEMQLTTDNIPVIVDKCIAFLYAHGILQEGIYRLAGSNTRIATLLDEFKNDAWQVQMSDKDFSAHDVANALKRFFRTLPEPLVTEKLYERWISASSISHREIKLREYTKLLDELPEINYRILKTLTCHLYAVHELQEKNLMPIDSLSLVWGPTILWQTAKLDMDYKTACSESGVIRDLIEEYYRLFRVDEEQIAREKKIQEGLEKFLLGSTKRKVSGDMRVYIHIHERDENKAVSITLHPSEKAATVLDRVAKMTHQTKPYDNLSLHEVICSKSMERPLYPTEKVAEAVLKWSIWDTDERSDNYLILKRNTLYPALLPYAKDPSSVYGEFKYADSKSKSFRKYTFEFSGAKLKYFKDSKATTEIESWNIEDIIWYIGHEHKRAPPTKLTFTFTPRTYHFKRNKEEPYFGNVVSVNTQEDLYKFVAAMIVGEHPEGLYPSVIL